MVPDFLGCWEPAVFVAFSGNWVEWGACENQTHVTDLYNWCVVSSEASPVTQCFPKQLVSCWGQQGMTKAVWFPCCFCSFSGLFFFPLENLEGKRQGLFLSNFRICEGKRRCFFPDLLLQKFNMCYFACWLGELPMANPLLHLCRSVPRGQKTTKQNKMRKNLPLPHIFMP